MMQNLKPNNNSSKRKRYSLADKKKLIQFQMDNPIYSYRDLSNKFNMPVGVISETLKNKDYYKNASVEDVKGKRKLIKTGNIDKILFQWFNIKRRANFIVTDDIMKNMASKFSIAANLINFKASNGWLHSFKNRYNIKSRRICGEEGCVNVNLITEFMQQFKDKCSMYQPFNILNCDETGLFFKLSPNKTLVLSDKDKACGKFSKERITILFTVGMDGTKYDPLIIGKYQNPRGIKNLDLNRLNLKYFWNKKAWMSLDIFNTMLDEMNERFQKENRYVLLILDNATVHPVSCVFSNIELLFLPPNTTSRIQPLDRGIIYSFKSIYKRLIQRKIFMECDDSNIDYHATINKLKLTDALLLINEAWNKVTEDTIINCFNNAFNYNIEADKTPEDENNFIAYDPRLEDRDMLDNEIEFFNNFKNSLDDDDESEDEVLDVVEPCITSCEAFAFAEKLELYFAEKSPQHIKLLHEIKDAIIQERKLRKSSLLDFFKRK